MTQWVYERAAEAQELAPRLGEILAGGGVAIVPTETVYGLICRYDDAAARDRIFALKRRPAEKLLQCLFADMRDLLPLGIEPGPQLQALSSFWPGPLTVIVRDTGGLTHGLRCPDHPLLQALLAALGAPLAGTSANPSGVDPAESAAKDFADLDGEPDVIVRGPEPPGIASTVLDLSDGPAKLVREGPIAFAKLRAALERAGGR